MIARWSSGGAARAARPSRGATLAAAVLLAAGCGRASPAPIVAPSSAPPVPPAASARLAPDDLPAARALRAAGVPASVAAITLGTPHDALARARPDSRIAFGLGREEAVDGWTVWYRFDVPLAAGDDPASATTAAPGDAVPLRELELRPESLAHADALRWWHDAVARAQGATVAAACGRLTIPDQLSSTALAREVRRAVLTLPATDHAAGQQLEIALVRSARDPETARIVRLQPRDPEAEAIAAFLASSGEPLACPPPVAP